MRCRPPRILKSGGGKGWTGSTLELRSHWLPPCERDNRQTVREASTARSNEGPEPGLLRMHRVRGDRGCTQACAVVHKACDVSLLSGGASRSGNDGLTDRLGTSGYLERRISPAGARRAAHPLSLHLPLSARRG